MKNTFIFILVITSFLSTALSQTTVEANNTQAEDTADVSILALFERWRAQFKKCYSSDNEVIYRRQIFMENYKIVLDHNSDKTNTWTMALNQFADMNTDEFEARMLIPRILSKETNEESDIDEDDEAFGEELRVEYESDICDDGTVNPATLSDQAQVTPGKRILKSPPSSWDWRNKGAVTKVKNQGGCGSCWAFSVSGMLEGVNFLRGNSLLTFSDQQLLDCCGDKGFHCSGCNGAWPKQAVRYVKKYGILQESQYPYIGSKQNCTVNSPTNGFYIKHKHSLFPSKRALKKGIYKQPVSVCVHATNWSLYSSGVFNNCSSKRSAANHAVLAVGYTSQGYWIIKNSWGVSWGSQGYITLDKGNTCGVYNSGLVARI